MEQDGFDGFRRGSMPGRGAASPPAPPPRDEGGDAAEERRRGTLPPKRPSLSMSHLGARPDPAGDSMPETIGEYRIERKLGAGAFGSVWLGVDPAGSRAAIKALSVADRDRRGEIRETFLLVQQLTDSHIATPLQLVEMPGGPVYTVMRFAPGRTLDKWLAEHGGMSWKERTERAFDLCGQIAGALDAAHRRGVMHLDVKPENVMVEDLADGGATARLLDLGLARRIVGKDPVSGAGTDEYIAPEIWAGRSRPDGRADQYSLACILHWMLAGTTPFGATFEAAYRRMFRRLGPGIGDKALEAAWREESAVPGKNVVAKMLAPPCPGLDKVRARALLKALAKDPKERYASCAEMVEAVRRGGGGAKAWLSLVAVAAVVVCGGVALVVSRQLVPATVVVRSDAISALREAAAAGDAGAAYELGLRHADGIGVEKDPEEAFRRFEAAARGGHAAAAFRVGDALRRGAGVAKDESAAAAWFRKGAEAGDAAAAGALAECLWEGVGVAKNPEEAFRVATDAAAQGVPAAEYVAGLALLEGVGPEQNPQRGAESVRLAAEGGHAEAQWKLSRLYAEGRGVSADEALAARWARKAAEGGVLAARLDMARRYAEGHGVVRSEPESARWLRLAGELDAGAADALREERAAAERERLRRKAAEEERARAVAADPLFGLRERAEGGEPAAIFELAKRLDEGIGARKDPAGAVRWWKALAAMPDVDEADGARREEAWGRYGFHLFEGTGCPRDVAAAMPWLERFAEGVRTAEDLAFASFLASAPKTGPAEPEWATDRNQVERGRACLVLARCLDAGNGTAKNVSRADDWYEQGAEAGNLECLAEFVRRIADGRIVVLETEKAVWYNRAAEAGVPGAKELYENLMRRGSRTRGAAPADPGPGASAAELHAAAMRRLDGDGVPKDERKAVEFFRRAAAKGHAPSQYALSVCLREGRGAARDQRASADWCRKAAEQGHASAQFNLGIAYERGDGVPKDAVQAARWFRKAADQGEASAQYSYGVCLYTGAGVREDRPGSVPWFRKAAAQGHEGAKKVLRQLGM